ncbi:MAG TPA: Ig-like domain-containing protein [Acidimicrobiales bacterium]|nr:Ig-like domain-containing protein [Acidimicrobiales bacterium]
MTRNGHTHLPRHLAMAAVAVGIAVAPVAVPTLAGAGLSRPKVACVITVNDDNYTTPENTALVVDGPGVVENDNICGTDGLVLSTSSPAHGTLTDFDDADGGFTYTPDPGFVGTDSFTYVLEDVEGSPEATVTITVSAPATTTTQATTTTTEATTTTTAAVEAVQAQPAFTG